MGLVLLQKDSLIWIKIISIIYYIATVFSLAIAVVSFTAPKIIEKIPGFPSAIAASSSAFIALGIVFIILAGISFFIAYGLQGKNNGARITLAAFCTLNVIGGIISVIEGSYLSSINLAFNLLVGGYLMFNNRVKIAFKKESSTKSPQMHQHSPQGQIS